jgi:RNA-directed DNA polymerase
MSLATPSKIRELQIKLYRKAKSEPGYRFYMLYDKIYREDILAHAYELARANKGAPGVDGQSFEGIESKGLQEWLTGIGEELRNKTYKPQPVRRVKIPKPGGGERPLGIPSIKDRVVQTAAKLVIEPIFEADLEPDAYGYRPKRSAQDAIQKVHKSLCEGYTDVVDADLSKYFDTIPHCELLQCVARRIVDREVLHLIKMWLTVPAEERDENGKRRLTGGKDHHCGTPQGGVVTPHTQKVTSNLSGGSGIDENRVRIDRCRIWFYRYGRCRAPATLKKPSVSTALASCCVSSTQSRRRSLTWLGSVRSPRGKPIATSKKRSD